MKKIATMAIISFFLICGCGTTAPWTNPPDTTVDKPENIKIGGEIKVRGGYLK